MYVGWIQRQTQAQGTEQRTSQKADPREMRRSPSPEQAPSLLQRIARMIGTHGVPSRCASVQRYTWRINPRGETTRRVTGAGW